ncbi:MAG: hypothetical protein WAU88_12530 [Candidatus Zixiibacteriota bacterium]
MDIEAQQVIAPLLNADERLLWTGKPKAGFILRNADTFMIPASLIFTYAAIQTYFYLDLYLEFPWTMVTAALLILASFQLLVGRYIWDARKRAKTFYGISDQRIFVIHGRDQSGTESWNLARLGKLRVVKSGFGCQSIDLNYTEWAPSGASFLPEAGSDTQLVSQWFESIEDADEVLKLLESLKEKWHAKQG